MPVSETYSGSPVGVFLYNSKASPVVVKFETDSSTSFTTIPSNDTVLLYMPSGTGARFSSTNGSTFEAVATMDTVDTYSGGKTYDWGATLPPESVLTPVLLVGWGAYHAYPGANALTITTIFLSILIGGITFSGSLIAFAKLAEVIGGKPTLFPGQKIFNAIMLIAIVTAGVLFILNPTVSYDILIGIIVLSLILGVLAVIPIGGADMPVVISLLNSYSGLAACAAGFVIQNNILIVSGALVGASGIILTNIMCKAMNRSLANVLFSGFGATITAGKSGKQQGEVNPILAEDAFLILEAASSVAFVPGYGLAVAQAQHVVRELGDLLEANGTEVYYAIHPVAGRMPGHMNVLLAEANVPYDKLYEMDDVNPIINTIDVAVVIGANDVVNPAARHDEDSPIYGMPIINVDYAKTVFVLKRSMAAGFAGISNELFFAPNTRMLFGDAKTSISAVVAEFKES